MHLKTACLGSPYYTAPIYAGKKADRRLKHPPLFQRKKAGRNPVLNRVKIDNKNGTTQLEATDGYCNYSKGTSIITCSLERKHYTIDIFI